ncbi:MAG TPA: HEPN domain-containing protein [Puia sp.]|nr:HEPN domain-containing protein [Puia sp.]
MNREVKTSECRNEPISGCCQSLEILDPVIYTICQSLPAEKIFLLGMYPANPKALGVEYDLMVLYDPVDKRPAHEFESLIANRCHDLAMISVSVFQIQIVNQLLNLGNIFFSFICDPQKILFDKGGIQLGNGRLCVQPSDAHIIRTEFSVLLSKAKAFLSGAISYRITQDFQLAAFMLHQTVEHGLNAFLSPLMGYRVQTHNLNKLFLYARRFSVRFYEIFPRDTDKEIRLYQTLHKAYIYGRYKNNFQVGEDTLQILIERSSALLALAELIFNQKIDVLLSGKTNIF